MESNRLDGNNYCISDKNGFVIEQTKDFKISSGYITDIVNNAKKIMNPNSNVNSIDIFFEDYTILIKDNSSTNLNMTMIVENK